MEKTLKKLAVLLIILISYNYIVIAQGTDKNGHSLSVATSFGLLSGEGEEIVYRRGSSDKMLSQFLWKFEPVFYIGAALNYGWQFPSGKIGFFIDTSFKYGIPNNLGSMEDRDWLQEAYPDFLSLYSVHNIKTETAILFDAHIGMSFSVTDNIIIKPFIFYGFMLFKWTAKGGSVLYPDYGGHFYLSDNIVVGDYKQTWNIVGIGTSMHYIFNELFDTEPFIKISPLIWNTSVDNHFLRNLVITDTMVGGFFIELGLNFEIKIIKNLIASVYVSNRTIIYTRGDALWEEKGKQPVIYHNVSGGEYNALNIGISVTYKLF